MRTLVLALLVFVSCRLVAGQTQYKVLWNFEGSTSSDGSNPLGDLLADHPGNLYGTTETGGTSKTCNRNCGTVFKLSQNSEGTWTETILHDFCPIPMGLACADGAYPKAGLVSDANATYTGQRILAGRTSAHLFQLAVATSSSSRLRRLPAASGRCPYYIVSALISTVHVWTGHCRAVDLQSTPPETYMERRP
jgi:hypothetical protein